MTDTPNNPSSPTPIVEPPSVDAKPKAKGFKRAAQLISRRTTDLIAIAIVTFGLFAVSGRLSDWWSTPADVPINPQQAVSEIAGDQLSWEDSQHPVTMQLGTLPVELQRATIKGDQKSLEEFVVPRLVKLVDSTAARDWPISSTDLKQDDTTKQMDQAERILLNGIRQLKPMRDTQHGSIYRIDEPGSMGFTSTFIGVRKSPDADLRVVAWSLSIPYRTDDWRVFFFRRIPKSSDKQKSFPLPDDAERIFSIGNVDGDGLISFARKADNETNSKPSDWQQFFSSRFDSGGWQPTRKWTQSDQLTSGRFENPLTGVVVEITINKKENSGVVNVMTRPRPPEK
jgi:hypothetical protein